MKLISIVSVLLLSLQVFALEVGSAIPELKLNDQFEKPIKVAADTKVLIFVADKKPSKTLSDYLTESKYDLTAKKVVYISDISKMPSMISSMFAKPAMKKYHYNVALDEAGDETKSWPRQTDKVTIMTLKNQKISQVQYLQTKEEIEKFFKAL
ncbi:MAG: hypothetical protein H7328_08435 [Bdellovibrio sp.]|nr:hypothetical protein [Bdellovibrio sp.]